MPTLRSDRPPPTRQAPGRNPPGFDPAPVGATNDPAKAARRIMTDDGFNLGILYRGERRPYQPKFGRQSLDPSELEQEFEI